MAAKKSKAARAGVVAGLAARSFRYARRVDWPAVWMRAKWLSHHSQRLYNNLSESERKEFLEMVVPTKSSRLIAKEDRGRVTELVTKAFTSDDDSGPRTPGGTGSSQGSGSTSGSQGPSGAGSREKFQR